MVESFHNDRVRHVMTEAVLSIHVDATVTELLRMVSEYPVHHLPVVDEGGVCGMLSSADLLKLEHFLPKPGQSGSLLNERFHIPMLMRQPVVSVGPDDLISDAAALMSRHAIHALPVINADRHLVGIVTTTDIMAGLLARLREGSAVTASKQTADPGLGDRIRAIAAATAAVADGTARDGVGALVLYLVRRSALLEGLRKDVSRYLKFGQDAQLHSKLLKDLDSLDRAVGQPFDL